MKKLSYLILGALLAIAAFLFGFLIRQPKIDKLKKQIKLLQKECIRLQELCQSQKDDFRNLLVQHKALKAFSFKKRAVSKDKLKESLILQYAIKDYLELLFKRVQYEQELSKDEIIFFNVSENLIEGKKLSVSDKIKIRDFIFERHSIAIKKLQECDYTLIFQKLSGYGKAT